jgi:hypothetical protein
VTALLPGQRGDGGFAVHPYRKRTGAAQREYAGHGTRNSGADLTY